MHVRGNAVIISELHSDLSWGLVTLSRMVLIWMVKVKTSPVPAECCIKLCGFPHCDEYLTPQGMVKGAQRTQGSRWQCLCMAVFASHGDSKICGIMGLNPWKIHPQRNVEETQLHVAHGFPSPLGRNKLNKVLFKYVWRSQRNSHTHTPKQLYLFHASNCYPNKGRIFSFFFVCSLKLAL